VVDHTAKLPTPGFATVKLDPFETATGSVPPSGHAGQSDVGGTVAAEISDHADNTGCG
jgi:hypothetical protein